ncbi:transposase [Mycobacterium xenopi]|uniref:transposase n=1 Tax=Mycobacterium xenopi TaxID=1789 RepID=UPI000A14780F|nr:transposase [Mycobacterium xenopi]MDA3642309.1 transposase [Mycobacterium xenopi]MDA3660371.1 transposase [Mycobacterium xenopi]MDA3664964.1 transposase [Mycobacterium xenopi]ORX22159.1 hypothetical protein AWC32_19795 [Mycobacterium xenopi]
MARGVTGGVLVRGVQIGGLDIHKDPPAAPAAADRVWVDNGYTGQVVATSAAKADVTVEVVSGAKPDHGFTVQPRRRVIERTNGWINHRRRIDRYYETTLTAHEGFLYLSQIALLLRQLDRSQLFDTL